MKQKQKHFIFKQNLITVSVCYRRKLVLSFWCRRRRRRRTTTLLSPPLSSTNRCLYCIILISFHNSITDKKVFVRSLQISISISISNAMAFLRSLVFSTLLLSLLHTAFSFYLPGVAPQDFFKVLSHPFLLDLYLNLICQIRSVLYSIQFDSM